jgi:hypothetical protein
MKITILLFTITILASTFSAMSVCRIMELEEALSEIVCTISKTDKLILQIEGSDLTLLALQDIARQSELMELCYE